MKLLALIINKTSTTVTGLQQNLALIPYTRFFANKSKKLGYYEYLREFYY